MVTCICMFASAAKDVIVKCRDTGLLLKLSRNALNFYFVYFSCFFVVVVFFSFACHFLLLIFWNYFIAVYFNGNSSNTSLT